MKNTVTFCGGVLAIMSNLFANGKHIFCSNPRDPRKLFFSKLISQYKQNKKDRSSLPLSNHYKCNKGPNLSVEALLLSAISFRLLSDSIPADASSDSPLSSACASNLSGPSVPRLPPLPFRFLTPSVFHILSDASVSGSDYSASALPFPSSRFPLSAVPSVLIGSFRPRPFPLPSGLFPCLPSDFGTQLFCNSFRPSLSRLTVATSAPRPRPFGFGRSP